MRLFQKPLLAPAVRAGKRAGLIAEQLAFHERFRDGPAVDGDERPRMAGAVVMDRLRDQLFASPRLPLDKDGGVRAGGLQDSRLEPQDGLALADDAGKTVIARLFGERFHVASAGPCETDDLADELERLFRLHQQLGALIVGEGHDLHDRDDFVFYHHRPREIGHIRAGPLAGAGTADFFFAGRQHHRALAGTQAVGQRIVRGHPEPDTAKVGAGSPHAVAFRVHDHDFHVQQLRQRGKMLLHKAPTLGDGGTRWEGRFERGVDPQGNSGMDFRSHRCLQIGKSICFVDVSCFYSYSFDFLTCMRKRQAKR